MDGHSFVAAALGRQEPSGSVQGYFGGDPVCVSMHPVSFDLHPLFWYTIEELVVSSRRSMVSVAQIPRLCPSDVRWALLCPLEFLIPASAARRFFRGKKEVRCLRFPIL